MLVRCSIGAHKVNEQSVYMETVYENTRNATAT